MNNSKLTPTTTHWGTYLAETRGGKLVSMRPHSQDKNPSRISEGIPSAINDDLRIRVPHIRKGWIANKSGRQKQDRGKDAYVPLPWDEAIEIASEQLKNVKTKFGNEAIYAGSYGWSWAGRFHHAQGQLHRFLNCFGGYTRSKGTYSYAASETIIPHVIGMSYYDFLDHHTDWECICENTTLIVAFGGLPIKNSQVTSGGVGRHTTREYLEKCRRKGIKFININPVKVDSDNITGSSHIAIRPGTDTALMIAIAYVLDKHKLIDTRFLSTYCVGYLEFQKYLRGESDGIKKTPKWAEKITQVPERKIEEIAKILPQNRTMIMGAWGLQRQEHGEQPHWMIIVLSAMLGQIGKPGGGFGLGYSSENGIGNPVKLHKWPTFPQLKNTVSTFIPVARVSDMLLQPGQPFSHNGQDYTYPNIKLVYWTGGNPFHHQMQLSKLAQAFRQPDTIVVNEIWWNSLARHADIVFPVATALERNDIAMGHWDQTVTPMHQAIQPIGESKTDYEIFSALAKKLNFEKIFTENKTEEEWLRWLWDKSIEKSQEAGFSLPDFDEFWRGGSIEVLQPQKHQILMQDFRSNPKDHPLDTPSGKIEIFSNKVASFKYSDCPGHPTWIEPLEWLGSPISSKFPIHLISGQPSNRLHSQLDNGSHSRKAKIKDREAVTLNPLDAAKRGIEQGDIVEIFNDRGTCLAGVIISDEISKNIASLPTGAWYDPNYENHEVGFCNHGNPNVLTRDAGSSKLSQGPIAHSTLVEIRKCSYIPQPVSALKPPKIEKYLK